MAATEPFTAGAETRTSTVSTCDENCSNLVDPHTEADESREFNHIITLTCSNCFDQFHIKQKQGGHEDNENLCPMCKAELLLATTVNKSQKTSSNVCIEATATNTNQSEVIVNRVTHTLPVSNNDSDDKDTNCNLMLEVYEENSDDIDTSVTVNSHTGGNMPSNQIDVSENEYQFAKSTNILNKTKQNPTKLKCTTTKNKHVASNDLIQNTIAHIKKRIHNLNPIQLFHRYDDFIHCPTCKKDITPSDFVATHLQNFSNYKHCKCPFCGRDVSKMETIEFLRHFRKHLAFWNRKLKKCTLCCSAFFKPYNLTLHMKQKHPAPGTSTNVEERIEISLQDEQQNEELCNIEGKSSEDATTTTSDTSDQLQQSMMGDIKAYLFNLPYDTYIYCGLCSEGFRVDEYLEEHMEKCFKDDKFICYLCNKHKHQDKLSLLLQHIFYQHFSTIRHIFKCKICNQLFLTFENHELHCTNVHMLQKPGPNSEQLATAIPVVAFKDNVMEEDIGELVNQEEDEVNTSKCLKLLETRIVKVDFTIRFPKLPCYVYCNVCKKDIERQDFFSTHVKQVLNPNHLKCVFCGVDTSKLSQVKFLKHLTLHFMCKYPRTKRTLCRTCKCVFFTNYNYVLHMKYKHQVKETPNTKVKKIVKQKDHQHSHFSDSHVSVASNAMLKEIMNYLQILLVCVSGQSIYIYCPSCSKEYYFKDYFTNHLHQCGIHNKYRCPLCKTHKPESDVFEFLQLFYDHFQTLKRIYRCTECDKIFLSLQNHILHSIKSHNSFIPQNHSAPLPQNYLRPNHIQVPMFFKDERTFSDDDGVSTVSIPAVREKSKRIAQLKSNKVSFVELHTGSNFQVKKVRKEKLQVPEPEGSCSSNNASFAELHTGSNFQVKKVRKEILQVPEPEGSCSRRKQQLPNTKNIIPAMYQFKVKSNPTVCSTEQETDPLSIEPEDSYLTLETESIDLKTEFVDPLLPLDTEPRDSHLTMETESIDTKTDSVDPLLPLDTEPRDSHLTMETESIDIKTDSVDTVLPLDTEPGDAHLTMETESIDIKTDSVDGHEDLKFEGIDGSSSLCEQQIGASRIQFVLAGYLLIKK